MAKGSTDDVGAAVAVGARGGQRPARVNTPIDFNGPVEENVLMASAARSSRPTTG